jgi:hypothetical protein
MISYKNNKINNNDNETNNDNNNDSNSETKYFNKNIFKNCIHCIRNIKTMDKEMINSIKHMSNEEKMEIIISLNDVVEHLKLFIE